MALEDTVPGDNEGDNDDDNKPVYDWDTTRNEDWSGWKPLSDNQKIRSKRDRIIEDTQYDNRHDFYTYTLEMKNMESGGEYYYVGKTKNIVTRLKRHIRKGGSFSGGGKYKIESITKLRYHACMPNNDREKEAIENMKESEHFLDEIKMRDSDRVLGGR